MDAVTMRCRLILLTCCTGLLPVRLPASVPSEELHRISEHIVRHREVLEVTASAETSVAIHNPLRWPQVRDAIPDGAYAEEGAVLVRFDETGPSHELARTRLISNTAEAELARDTADIDNSQIDLRDRRDANRDQVAVLEARRQRLLAIPDPSEVAIAESRLRVATLAWDAASNEYAKAESRHADALISRQELESREDERDSAAVELNHAVLTLEQTRLPAPSSEIQRIGLEIANARLELEKLEREITDNEVLVEIRKRGSVVRMEQLSRQIAEREEDLQNTQVLAPSAGHVMQMPDFRRNVLEGGDRMWRNHVFMRIPDPATLVFKGVIPEASRRFFAEGDPATLLIVGFKDVEVAATVVSISSTARDTADRESVGWGANVEYGVKVHDIVLRPLAIEDWMRVGAHAQAIVTATQPTVAPAVPLPFVRILEGRPHLVHEGRAHPVTGTVSGNLLILDDTAWLNRTVSLQGSPRVPRSGDPGDENSENAPEMLYSTSGELVPATTTPVVVGRIHRMQKITWLIPEDSAVTQGMVVARLDDKETLDDIVEWESRLTSATSDREAQEQNSAIQEREQAYQLALAANNAEIARLDHHAKATGQDAQKLADLRRALALARIRERSARRRLERLEQLPSDRVSAVERVEAQRSLERAALNLEASEIRLAVAESDAPTLAEERLRVAYEEARLNLHARQVAAETERIRTDAELLKSRRRENHTRRNLEERRRRLANLELTAPCAGTVRYNRVWSNNSFSRAQAGQLVGSRFVPLQIVDATRMEVRAEVPEHLFPQIAAGMPVEVRIPSITDQPLAGTLREVEFLFEQRRPKDSERGLYSAHEALGETVFYIRVEVAAPDGVRLKPGAVATLTLRKVPEVRP